MLRVCVCALPLGGTAVRSLLKLRAHSTSALSQRRSRHKNSVSRGAARAAIKRGSEEEDAMRWGFKDEKGENWLHSE